MALDRIKDAALPQAVSDVVGDLADLFQKEMRLARAELSAKIATKLRAGVWMSAAGVLGLIAGLLVVQAAVFAIASYGIALHWSCLIVAGVVAGDRRYCLPQGPFRRAGGTGPHPNHQSDQTRHRDRQGATDMT